MKYRTTAKELRVYASNTRKAGFCDLQTLLHYESPKAYTCGVYGWNFDVYEVYNLTITTGYRGMVGERLKYIGEFEELAEKILYDRTKEEDTKRRDLEYALQAFCEANGGYVPTYRLVLGCSPDVWDRVHEILKDETNWKN